VELHHHTNEDRRNDTGRTCRVAASLKVMRKPNTKKEQRLCTFPRCRTAPLLQSNVDVVDVSNDHLLDLKATLCQAAARVGYSAPS
jgi:hypothetical protein